MTQTRRTFLRQVAVVPLALRLAPTSSKPRIVVVGAGAFGGWTALQLAERGAQVVLVDAWGPGNTRSSSGGETRVIRAVYGTDRIYVEMVKRAFTLWEKLDASTDEKLYVDTGALWLFRESVKSDDAYIRSSLPILGSLGFPVDQLPLDDAARRYPQIDFRGIRSVWLERRAGALLARRGCAAVRDAFEKAGGIYRTAHVEPGAIADGKLAALRLDDGAKLEADVYVFACGPWLGRLFPDAVGDWIRPTRQEVFYFGAPAGSQRYVPGPFPIWIDFGERIVYGVPDIQGRGVKIADDTRGDPVDPTSLDRTPSQAALARARRVLAERFPELANAPLLESRVCQYENSPDGHLIFDRHPGASNVWLLGGGSGHGYKLAPAVGELTADAILAGKEIPAMFRLDPARRADQPATQFDSKKD
ncbi:MAG TPA: FAD-dependent oxidoreductase [Thermoanaerobaculia bacterium]|nr:FAD-dependent oxidoreductase [Thermoanaerobaculia bacterium]